MKKAEEKKEQTTQSTGPSSMKQALGALQGTKSKSSIAHGVGRRKSSVARVWLKRGTGVVTINGKEYKKYFDTDVSYQDIEAPFAAVPQATQFDVSVNVSGGGKQSQSGAVKLGFARALVQYDESMRPALRKAGLVTVDSRVKERKKPGQKAARRKFQFVKR